jgi:hypothetical protein
MVSKMWDEPASNSDAPTTVELIGHDNNEPPQTGVGDVGLNRRGMHE